MGNMVAIRLTEEEVHQACSEIVAQGERPTALNLLDKLGRGSLTTITKYLNSWNSSDQAQAIKAETLPILVKLPPELLKEGDDLLKKMWNVAKSLTDAELDVQREALKQAEIANQSKVEEAFKFSEAQSLKIERLEEELQLFKEQLKSEKDAHLKAINQLNDAEKNNISLSKDNERLSHQIIELNSQIVLLQDANKLVAIEIEQLQQRFTEESGKKDAVARELDIQVGKQQTMIESLTTVNDDLKLANEIKNAELSKQMVELEKARIYQETSVVEVTNLKDDLLTAQRSLADVTRQVANLEGQLTVYKSLDTVVEPISPKSE